MTPLSIAFEVHGEPKPQGRPRAFVRQTSVGPIARVYDGATAEAWKSLIAEAGRPFIPETPLVGPLALSIEFWLPRPSTHFKASDRARPLKLNAPTFHVSSRDDVDNLLKAVMDAMTRLRFWVDDGHVSVVAVTKLYEDPATGPGALIRIERPASYAAPAATPEQASLLEGVP